ncbi:hypothetical protein [Thalassococcus lentus]|uniref:YopX protein domain-containing protein n=1 Tax=Thalassococcus lentus TaxID=1210524 RepID=A0ABT4XTM5_9RHOB|nr:hypothetical protein [Thalassococcus lentus]MDA7425302.1 hypothetical protein [Thalassococcus lentus]
MGKLTRYTRREQTNVTAIKIDMETDGFTYRKWGGEQIVRPGDWLVDNNGDVYTVDGEAFEATYAKVSQGIYTKTAHVWAREAESDGQVQSTSGFTQYHAGDMVVFRDEREIDGWAMSKADFAALYQVDE